MSRFTAMLFDLDGTLLDTLEDLAASMNAVLARRGFPVHDVAAYRIFVGDGVENLVRRALPEAARRDAAIVGALVPDMRAEYGGRWHDRTRPYDGIMELLDAAAARGVRLAVLSNKPHAATLDVVRHYFPAEPFSVVLGARAGVPIKPDAGAALEAARLMGASPASMLYLGDTDTDMQTALAAGMYPVGALWGFREAEELAAAGARVLARHPSEVLALL